MSHVSPVVAQPPDVDLVEPRARSTDRAPTIVCEPGVAIVLPEAAVLPEAGVLSGTRVLPEPSSRPCQSAATIDAALDRLTSRDAVAAICVGVGTRRLDISAAAGDWIEALAPQNDSAWLLITEVDLGDSRAADAACSMVRLVDDTGVIVRLPDRRNSLFQAVKAVDRMCQILELVGLESATVFCAEEQRRAVAARLRYRRVIAGFQVLGNPGEAHQPRRPSLTGSR